MADNRQAKAIEGAACAPLSREQKRNICMLASKAWENQGRPYYDPTMDPAYALSKSAAEELFRHEEQQRLVGRKHLTACGQADYFLLKAHFARMAGLEGAAEAAEDRIPGDDARRANAVLRRELAAARSQIADPRRYAETIARSKYKAGIETLTAKQVWTIVFDVRRAVSARKKKASQPETPF